MTPTDRLAWRTSTYSGAGENCVDVAPTAEGAAIRHSKRHTDGLITFTHDDWSAFVTAARDDLPAAPIVKDGADTLVRAPGVELRYDAAEWSAFRAGAADGEFDFAR